MSSSRPVRVALLVAPESFERFYAATLGLDRDAYVHRYRNDFVWNYAEALREHGVEVVAYVPALGPGAKATAVDGFTVRFVALPWAWDRMRGLIARAVTPLERYAGEALHAAMMLPDLRRGLQEDAIDVLYVQEYWTGRFDLLVRSAGVPVVAGEHGGSGGRHVHVGKGRALRRAAAITVQTTAEARRLRDRYGVVPHHVTNGVDVDFFAPGDPEAGDAVILTVARLVDAQKRISDLIRAVALLPAPWRLEIVGTGPDEASLRALATEAGVGDRVRFVGWVDGREALRERYRNATVFALPSTWEAVTLAVLEAMACGTPAVVTPLASFLDLIYDGVDGMIVPPADPAAIARAIERIAADRARLSTAARAKVVARFSRRDTMGRLAALLRAAADPAVDGATPALSGPAGDDHEAPLRFAFVGGDIAPATVPGGPVARVRALPGVRAALALPAVRRLAAVRTLSALVRERTAFARNELLHARGPRRYHLRGSELPVLLRHGTDDVWTFDELLHLRLYEPPAEVRSRLDAVAGGPRILDLGANIGLSGAFFLSEWPAAELVSYEPDPANLELLREVVASCGKRDSWQVRAACAGTGDGRVPFIVGEFNESRVAMAGDESTTEVPVEDVLPAMATVDMLKMDIEGAEWEILADERFGAVPIVVLEYHPRGCPGADPHAEAARLLTERGYRVIPVFRGPDGVGMAWAIRD